MKSVCVFLSSSTQAPPAFQEEAEVIGEALAKHGYGVVFGGSNEGCMGRLATGVLKARGSLTGVVPEMDFLEGIVQENMTRKILVRDMGERKAKMLEHSDAFLVFPGGLGTLDEVTDVLALRQINTHQKPMVFYNYLGFWAPFIECLETMVQQRLITTPLEKLFEVTDRPSSMLDYLDACLQT